MTSESKGRGLARRTLLGMVWAYGAFFGRRVFTFISTAILARILVPADFGLIGSSLLILNFMDIMRGLGINDALIYNDERPEDTADSAFWINTGIGVLQFAVAVVLAPLAVTAFDDARLTNIVRVMAIAFVFNGLGQTHNALLQKELLFKRRFLPDLASSLIKGIVSVILAVVGLGVWSLIIGHILGSVMQTATLWLVIPWRPRLRFFGDRARSLWNYGIHILMFHVLGILLEQADQLVIGTLLGQTQLGYYTIASKVPELIIANFSLILTTVLFPTYAKMKDDLPMLTRGFFTTTRHTAFVVVGAGFGMAAVAPELIRVVYGSQWDPAVDLFRVLAFLGVVYSLPWAAGDLLKAIGRPDIPTKLLVIETLYSFPLIWYLGWSTRVAVMASFGNLIAGFITVALRLWITSRVLKINPLIFIKLFRSPLIAGAALYGSVMLWRWWATSLPDIVILLVAALLGAAVYGAILFALEKDEFFEVFEMFQSLLRRRSRDDEDDEGPDEPGGGPGGPSEALSEHAVTPAVTVPSQPLAAPVVATPPDEASQLRLLRELVQHINELTCQSPARATLLSVPGRLLAKNSDLPSPIVAQLFYTLDSTWRSSRVGSPSLLRFVELPDIGELVLYSARIQDGLMLSLVFQASTPVRTVRQQARCIHTAIEQALKSWIAVPDLSQLPEPQN